MEDSTRPEDLVLSGVRVNTVSTQEGKALVSYVGAKAAHSRVPGGAFFLSGVRMQAVYTYEPFPETPRKRSAVLLSYNAVYP